MVGVNPLEPEAAQSVVAPAAGPGRHIRIRPVRAWSLPDFRELWAFRDLLWLLAGRDVKLRYKQTALGILWVVLQPLLAAGIFTVIFGRVAQLPSDGHPYLLFVFAALLPWSLFSGTLQRASTSLLADARLVAKVYFPRLLIPLASALAVLIDFAVTAVVMALLLLLFGVAPSANLLLLPVLTLVVLLNAAGVSLWLSAFNVYYRDFMYALPFLIQVWLYASPVVYSSQLIPAQWRPLYALNPMVGAIDGFRWALLGGDFPGPTLGIAVVVGCLAFLGGSLVFRRIERSFADVI